MDPPKHYKELLKENQILREENQKQNNVILVLMKRNQDMENQLSSAQSLIAALAPLQQKAQLGPHPPSNGLQTRQQQLAPLKPIRVRTTCSDKDVYLPGAISVGGVDPGSNRSGDGFDKLPPIRTSSAQKDFSVTNHNEPLDEGTGAKIGPLCPARPSGKPPLAPKARRRLTKNQTQQSCEGEGCERQTPEKERLMARERAAFDRQFKKVDTYLRAEVGKVIQQMSLVEEGEGDLGLTLEDKKAELESSLQEINHMRREWETKGGKVKHTGSAEMKKANEVTLNKVEEEEKRSEVMKGHEGGTQQAPDSNVLQCDFCSRSFAPHRLEKHSQICAKAISKGAKRKVYDSLKHRVAGTVLAGYIRRQM